MKKDSPVSRAAPLYLAGWVNALCPLEIIVELT